MPDTVDVRRQRHSRGQQLVACNGIEDVPGRRLRRREAAEDAAEVTKGANLARLASTLVWEHTVKQLPIHTATNEALTYPYTCSLSRIQYKDVVRRCTYV